MWVLLVLIGTAPVSAHLQDLAFDGQVASVNLQNDEQVEIINSLASSTQMGKSGPNEKAVFTDCGFHAKEWISPAFCQWLGKEFRPPVEKTHPENAGSHCIGTDSNMNFNAGWCDPAGGGPDNWAFNQGIKYSSTFELQDTGRYGFTLPESQIKPTCQETLLAVKYIANYVLEYLY